MDNLTRASLVGSIFLFAVIGCTVFFIEAVRKKDVANAMFAFSGAISGSFACFGLIFGAKED